MPVAGELIINVAIRPFNNYNSDVLAELVCSSERVTILNEVRVVTI